MPRGKADTGGGASDGVAMFPIIAMSRTDDRMTVCREIVGPAVSADRLVEALRFDTESGRHGLSRRESPSQHQVIPRMEDNHILGNVLSRIPVVRHRCAASFHILDRNGGRHQ